MRHRTGRTTRRRLGISTVYQDLALCENLDVVGNLFLGAEERRRSLLLDEIRMERRARDLLTSLDVRSATSGRRSPRCPAASGSRWRSPAPCSATRGW